jgi:transketolase
MLRGLGVGGGPVRRRQRLERVVAIVDVNGLEQSGPAPYGHDTSVLAGRFRAFGWRVLEVDGHDMGEVLLALEATRDPVRRRSSHAPVKGKGVSFLEGAEGWHGKALDETQRDRALAEIAAPSTRARVEPRRRGGPQQSSRRRPGPVPVDYPRRSGRDPQRLRQRPGEARRRGARPGGARRGREELDQDRALRRGLPRALRGGPDRRAEHDGRGAGARASNKRPCVATFAAFLTRAHDFIRMAVHSRPSHLLICGSHAGVSIGEDGPSQMGLEDIAMFRASTPPRCSTPATR